MRVLVTGGAGFIGSHYVRSLVAGEYTGGAPVAVTVLDALTYAGRRDNLPADGLDFVHGDVCDLPLLLELCPGHDAVVHFAAESHVDRSVVSGAEFARSNVQGTQAVLEASLRSGVPRVVHVSTDEVYGSIEHGAWTEEYPLLPNSPYAASKAGSDLLARAYWRTHGLNVSVTRCSNNYGPYQHAEKLIPRFITRLLRGATVPLYGSGRNVREWLHVADHCRAVHQVLMGGRAGEVYHVGGGEERTNLEVAQRLVALCGADPGLIRHVTDRKGHDLRYALDDGRIRRELGYAPRVAFEDGLRSTVDWYREHPGWWAASAGVPDSPPRPVTTPGSPTSQLP
ncbi:dTDP-glucose 4,6-dehydratase [Streptomyces sp. DSM 44915]|uniref:dTDP-glucose 4,6-dehydratase n=1 Tax=Streptomyces chisholmiae TaxID=3075540 RepID=A0ABU2JMD1_9ACTN|nr:dTDP-glucose 4,6-dehydratase [Streptomyces sp. DSM 44915]MDT0266129.1 dTDP-glucose 4,6-dehydratase [Streptomyces sp. DSM 44915]